MPPARGAAALARIVLAGLLFIIVADMLAGVVLRYVATPLATYWEGDPPPLFWVDEVGQTALTWLTLLGAGVGVAGSAHFRLAFVDPGRRPHLAVGLQRLGGVLIAGFGVLLAAEGAQLTAHSANQVTPALGIGLGVTTAAAVAGGIAILTGALVRLRRPPGSDPA